MLQFKEMLRLGECLSGRTLSSNQDIISILSDGCVISCLSERADPNTEEQRVWIHQCLRTLPKQFWHYWVRKYTDSISDWTGGPPQSPLSKKPFRHWQLGEDWLCNGTHTASICFMCSLSQAQYRALTRLSCGNPLILSILFVSSFFGYFLCLEK